jgi:hypothetical protein
MPVTGVLTLIADGRIEELRALRHPQLDFAKLIRLCEEINTTYSHGCYVIMLTRALLDHVPPVFGKTTFIEVANSSAKSSKQALLAWEYSARKIADAHLHGPMRKSEALPFAQQVHFAFQLDVLLAEIVRVTP